MSEGGNGSGSGDADDGGEEGETGSETGRANGGVGQLSRYFDALADERRRYALYYLYQHGTANLDELARYTVGRETGRPPEELAAEEYESVVSELHHKHLPRLADYGLVEFDPRSEQVRFREPTRTFSTLLWLSQLVEGEGQR